MPEEITKELSELLSTLTDLIKQGAELTSKLSEPVKKLVEEFIHQQILKYAVYSGVAVLLLAILCIVIILFVNSYTKAFNKSESTILVNTLHSTYSDDHATTLSGIGSCLVGVLSVLTIAISMFLACMVSNLIAWSTSPYAEIIEYVQNIL